MATEIAQYFDKMYINDRLWGGGGVREMQTNIKHDERAINYHRSALSEKSCIQSSAWSDEHSETEELLREGWGVGLVHV